MKLSTEYTVHCHTWVM